MISSITVNQEFLPYVKMLGFNHSQIGSNFRESIRPVESKESKNAPATLRLVTPSHH
ncbi:hypothetical protein EMIT0P260_10153 [Pseudomonas sp. IT-P260]